MYQIQQSVTFRGRGVVLAAVRGGEVVEIFTTEHRKSPLYVAQATAELEKLKPDTIERGHVCGWFFVPVPQGDCIAPEPVYF